MIIKLDHSTDPPRATLLQSFPAPEGNTISSSQGNVQLLGNNSDWATSNAFIGWGSQPYVTEHLPNGTVIYQANVNADGPMNYRAFKFNLTTNPREIRRCTHTHAARIVVPQCFICLGMVRPKLRDGG